MALTRPSSWTTYFSNRFISNSDLFIYDDTNTKILDKTNIISYFYKGVNSYVCSSYPIDEVELVVAKWKDLSNAIKEYLTTKGNKILVEYVVGGDGSSTKSFFVDDWEMDNRQFTMTIKFKGYLQLKTKKASYQYLPVATATYCASSIDTITTSEIEDYNVNYIPPKITEGELLQNLALTMCSGMKYDDNTSSIAFIGLPQSTLAFNELNIRDVMNIKLSKDPKNAIVLGSYITTGAGHIQQKVGFALSYRSRANDWEIDDYLYDFSFVQVSPASPSVSHLAQIYNDHLTLLANGTINASFDVYADYVYLENNQEEDYISVSSYLLLNSDTQKEKIKNYVEMYYGMDNICEFDCRIDPSIEPLDCIRVGDKRIWVEEVNINFNGGYTGRIKGRIQTKILKPIIKNISYDGGTFSFEIYNPNPFSVVFNIKYSRGTATTTFFPNIASKSSQTINQTNCPALTNSFNEKDNQDLEDDVYVYFSEGIVNPTIDDSDNTIVIEADI